MLTSENWTQTSDSRIPTYETRIRDTNRVTSQAVDVRGRQKVNRWTLFFAHDLSLNVFIPESFQVKSGKAVPDRKSVPKNLACCYFDKKLWIQGNRHRRLGPNQFFKARTYKQACVCWDSRWPPNHSCPDWANDDDNDDDDDDDDDDSDDVSRILASERQTLTSKRQAS